MELAQGLLPLASALINRANDRAIIGEKQAAVAKLRAEYPDLLTPGENLRSLNCAAKNIRIQLKKAFPGHKFSVRIESYSMGNSITVAWTDGPAGNRVEAIVDCYQQGHFDGQTDYYENHNSPWCEAFGGAKYVTCSRDYSPKIKDWLQAHDAGATDYFERFELQRRRHIELCRLNIKHLNEKAE